HQAGGRGVVLLAGVAGGDHALRHDRLQFGEVLDGDLGADALVLGEDDGLAALLRDLEGDGLVGRPALRPGPGGAAMALGGVDVGGLTADRVLARQVLGGLDHAADRAEALDRLGSLAAALQAVVEHGRAGARAAAHGGGVVLDVAHALGAAGD